MARLWPKSLAGQLLVSLAIALLIAQLINAAMIYRAQQQASENLIASSAAVRLIGAWDRIEAGRELTRGGGRRGGGRWMRRAQFALSADSPVTADMQRMPDVEEKLAGYLAANGVDANEVATVYLDDPMPRINRRPLRRAEIEERGNEPQGSILVAVQRPGGEWLSARYPAPRRPGNLTRFLAMQTLVLYLVLMIPVALIIRRASKPMRTLRGGVEAFRDTQQPMQVAPEGPSDISQLTRAFNDMSARISAMINEKDVMLGAIGHDLKTPLAALRVRLENVEDDAQRAQMIAGVEDLNRTLDDILALARVGHPIGAPEPTNLTALIETVTEEFADLGKDVHFTDSPRVVMPLHVTWMRRAIRNLVSNAVRYGESAAISLHDTGGNVIIRIDDKGPGIPEAEITAMFEPFARLESSRNQATGGSGLGLTLARAIAEQHGAQLHLTNLSSGKNLEIQGLRAEIFFPKPLA